MPSPAGPKLGMIGPLATQKPVSLPNSVTPVAVISPSNNSPHSMDETEPSDSCTIDTTSSIGDGESYTIKDHHSTSKLSLGDFIPTIFKQTNLQPPLDEVHDEHEVQKLSWLGRFARRKLVSSSKPVVSTVTPASPTSSENSSEAPDSSTVETTSSDETEPSPTNVVTSSMPDLDLATFIPPILKPKSLRFLLHEIQTEDEVRILAALFLQCFNRAIRSTQGLPYEIRLDPTFRTALHSVIFTKDWFLSRLEYFNAFSSNVKFKTRTQLVFHSINITILSLASFLQVAELALARTKPLPSLPEDVAADTMQTTPEPVLPPPTSPDSNVSSGKQSSASGLRDNDLEDFPVDDKLHITNPLPPMREIKSILRRLLTRVGKVSRASSNVIAAGSSSPNTKLDGQCSSSDPGSPQNGTESVCGDNVSQERPAPAHLRVPTTNRRLFNIRDSLLIFPDPAAPELDVKMPRPEGDAFDMYLNDEGVVVGASLSALVRMLTSKESVTDYEFTDMFFVCFRFFTSPLELFNRLVDRYNEHPPSPLSEAQKRVWENEAGTVKFRVANMLLTWLDLHWRRDLDQKVFVPCLRFVFSRLSEELPFTLSIKVARSLMRCVLDNDYRGCRMQRRTERAQMALQLKDEPPTGFRHPLWANMCQGDFSGVDITDFHNKAGREELARQLTMKASQLYCLIDPEDAVVFWRDGGSRRVGRTVTNVISFEKSICLWVIHTILTKASLATRAKIITFWIDVATICLRMRNFSGAKSILGGLEHSSVYRLQRTTQIVFQTHRKKYKELQDLFMMFGNYRHYRASLNSNEMPAVPLLCVLKHDITATKAAAPCLERCAGDNTNKTSIINVSSYRVVAKTVRAMELCHIPYKLQVVDYIQDWLQYALRDYANSIEESSLLEDFNKKSLLLEPRETKSS